MAKVSVIGKRVRQRMLDLNIHSVRELEAKAGLPRDSVRHLLSGRTGSMRSGKLPALAAALQLTLDELTGGTPAAAANGLAAAVAGQTAPATHIGKVRFDGGSAAAFGAGANPRLRWFAASGGNMQPTIAQGDLVLVDEAVTQVLADGIYCLQVAGGEFVFRRVQVQAADGRAIVSNDCERYATERGVDLASLAVAGKVLGIYKRS